MVAFLDIETYSLCDLRAMGGRIYANDPSTRIMCACIYTDAYHLWLPTPATKVAWPLGLPEEKLIVHEQPNIPSVFLQDTIVAHNGDDFDFRVWRAQGFPLKNTIDTLPLARAAGYPGALDTLSQRFLGIGKDATASRLLSKACKKDTPPPPGVLSVIASYNVADVVALRRIYEKVRDFAEEPLYSTHLAINERGVLFDRDFARHVRRLANENVERAAAEIETLTDGFLRREDLTKRNRVLEWVRRQGIDINNLRRETVDLMLDNPEEWVDESTQGPEAPAGGVTSDGREDRPRA